MKNFLQILIICFCFLFATCGRKSTNSDRRTEGHEYIYVMNNSEKAIICQQVWRAEKQLDTHFYCSTAAPTIAIVPYIKEGFSGAVSGTRFWEDYFENEELKYIQFFILNYGVYENIPCDTINKYHMVLHRYQLTLEDLQRMNWTVVYPSDSVN